LYNGIGCIGWYDSAYGFNPCMLSCVFSLLMSVSCPVCGCLVGSGYCGVIDLECLSPLLL
jgi:hypothetical protein